jgi:hypothetical protein
MTGAGNTNTSGEGNSMVADDEASRYREAAELALQQIEWCVMYLHSIRKSKIATALDQNRSAIARRLAEGE